MGFNSGFKGLMWPIRKISQSKSRDWLQNSKLRTLYTTPGNQNRLTQRHAVMLDDEMSGWCWNK